MQLLATTQTDRQILCTFVSALYNINTIKYIMALKITPKLIQFTAKPYWYSVRGIAMIVFGGLIAALSLVAPNVYMLGGNVS
jgi:hypothetical protein